MTYKYNMIYNAICIHYSIIHYYTCYHTYTTQYLVVIYLNKLLWKFQLIGVLVFLAFSFYQELRIVKIIKKNN
jgi:hypothetical protein